MKIDFASNRPIARIITMFLADCLMAGLALEAPAAAYEALPFYTSTFTGGKIAVSSTDERSRRSFDYLNPAMS